MRVSIRIILVVGALTVPELAALRADSPVEPGGGEIGQQILSLRQELHNVFGSALADGESREDRNLRLKELRSSLKQATQSLEDSIARDDLKTVQQALSGGLDVSGHEDDQFLKSAVCEGTPAMVDLVFGHLVVPDLEPPEKRAYIDGYLNTRIFCCISDREDLRIAEIVSAKLTPEKWTPEQVRRVLDLGRADLFCHDPVTAAIQAELWDLARDWGAPDYELRDPLRRWVRSAIRDGDPDLLAVRLRESPELDSEDYSRLLSPTASHRNESAARLLLGRGAEPDTKMLDFAIKEGALEIAGLFLENGALPSPAALDRVSSQKDREAIAALVAHGVDPSEFVWRSFQKHDDELLRRLLGAYFRPLFRDSPSTEQAAALALFDAGIDPWFYSKMPFEELSNETRHSPEFLGRGLLAAAEREDWAIMDAYIAAGADPEVDGVGGDLVLRFAAKSGSLPRLEALRELGARDQIAEGSFSAAAETLWDQAKWTERSYHASFLPDDGWVTEVDYSFLLPSFFETQYPANEAEAEWDFISGTSRFMVGGLVRRDHVKEFLFRISDYVGLKRPSNTATSESGFVDPEETRWRRSIFATRDHISLGLEVHGPSLLAPEVDVLASRIADSMRVPRLRPLITVRVIVWIQIAAFALLSVLVAIILLLKWRLRVRRKASPV